jgi:CBS domain-containing protein
MNHQPITQLMQPRTQTVAADDTMEAIEDFLAKQGQHWVPVMGDHGELLGVISDADLVRFHRDKRDPAATAAWQLCTYRPLTVKPTATAQEVARLMVDHRIHHLVVAEGGAICGVVSSMDFVKSLA